MLRPNVPCLTTFLALVVVASFAQNDPHYVGNRTTMVHLFEWKWTDIAQECENFLGPMGYGGVQVSPINENLVMENRPWYERYQPLSYKILTRSGTEAEFKDMVSRCNKVGLRIYVDAVINHMTGSQRPAFGTGGSSADTLELDYPGVPYSASDFHRPCAINNYNDSVNVRDCELSGLHDLDQSKDHVRQKIVEFMNHAIDLGVAGFRIDAAKHMWPEDLKVMYGSLKNLDENIFGPNKRSFIYQEVIDLGNEAVKKEEYLFATVIDFVYGVRMGYIFRENGNLTELKSLEKPDTWNMLESNQALVMIDNHDNQRGHGAGGDMILTYKAPKQYKMAIAFMQAYPYGHTRVMSSFAFSNPSTGPPMDQNEEIISPQINRDGSCANGWVCEHRWPQIYHMVQFRNLMGDEPVANWWSNGHNQIAFSRGSKGFVAFNTEGQDLRRRLQTGLPPGIYCDVISGGLVNRKCTGKTVVVSLRGDALIEILSNDREGVLALHVQAKRSTL